MKSNIPRYNLSYIYIICLTSAMGGLLWGYDWIVIGGAKPFYELFFSINGESFHKGFAMSSAIVGCLIGATITGLYSDKFGRKRLLLMAGFLFSLSAIGTGIADNYHSFIIYRILGGIGMGVASSLSPVYIAEVSPAEIRGRMVSLNQLAVVIGILAAQIVNWSITRNMEPGLSESAILESWYGQTGWRWMFISEIVPASLFFLLMFFIPESPRWLVQRKRHEEAKHILTKIGDTSYAASKIKEIREGLEMEAQYAGFRHLIKGKLASLVLIGITLAAYQSFCGVDMFFYYAEEIFSAAGYELSAIMLNIVTTGIVLLVFTIIGMYTVDTLGRRTLLLSGTIGLVFLHSAIAVCYLIESQGIHVLILVLAAIGCYAWTVAPVIWILLAELFPNHARGACMAICVFVLWTVSAIAAQVFPYMIEIFNATGSFFIFSGICLAGLVYCWKVVPETKGKTLEELETELLS